MKWNCEIIRDLIPGYVDDIASGESRTAVEKHAEECEACREALKAARQEIPAPEFRESERVDYLKTVHSYARKKAVRAVASVVLMALACLALYAGYHWATTVDVGDRAEVLRFAGHYFGEREGETVLRMEQKGDFFAALLADEAGNSRMLILDRDDVFASRFGGGGGKPNLRAGEIGSFNFGRYGTEALIVVGGVNLPEEAAAYQFYNNGVTYTVEITDHASVLDVYYLVGQNDINGFPVLLDADGNEIMGSNAGSAAQVRR